MMKRTPGSFDVGELLFSSEFTVTPHDVAAWERDQILDGRDDRPNFRSRLERPPMAGSLAPEGLLRTRALDAVERHGELGGCTMVRTSAGKLRSLGSIVVGQRLCCVASVRHRSQRGDGACFLTLAVELRAGWRKLAELELGVEVTRTPEPADAWFDIDRAA